MKRIVWQPTGFCDGSYGFDVWLDRKFGIEMFDTSISPQIQREMNKRGKETAKRFGYTWLEPFNFEEDRAFVGEFHLGAGGIWLATDRFAIDDLKQKVESDKPIVYSSHNVDCSRDAYTLMALVDQWVNYSEELKRHAV